MDEFAIPGRLSLSRRGSLPQRPVHARADLTLGHRRVGPGSLVVRCSMWPTRTTLLSHRAPSLRFTGPLQAREGAALVQRRSRRCSSACWNARGPPTLAADHRADTQSELARTAKEYKWSRQQSGHSPVKTAWVPCHQRHRHQGRSWCPGAAAGLMLHAGLRRALHQEEVPSIFPSCVDGCVRLGAAASCASLIGSGRPRSRARTSGRWLGPCMD